MIDHKNKLLFIHIPKNAGTSIERTVFKDCQFNNSCDYDYLNGYSTKYKINLQHATVKELIENKLINKEILKEYNSFAVTRNPFSRSISSYFWLMKDLKIKDNFKNFLLEEGEFSIINLRKKNIYVQDHMYTQTKFVKHNSSISVKRLLKFENLLNDFNTYMQELDVDRELKIHFKKNKKNKFEILKLLNKENVRLIQDRYEEDFVNLDYNINFNSIKFLISNG